MRRSLTMLLLGTLLLRGEDLDILLGEYAQKADLSEQTKRESAGFLQVYTRQDLDRMQIRQLKELIEQIPFFRYQEDDYGLTRPFYMPAQPSRPNAMRVYINDRALGGVFTNDGLRVFGQMSLAFIDHAEIYIGAPAQSFGIEGAFAVIKLYTKDPARENTSLAGAILGSRGTTQIFGYDAQKLEHYSYLAYADYGHLKRPVLHSENGADLKRDKEYVSAYGEVRRQNHRFEIQAISGRADAFLGDSPTMRSIDPWFDFRYLYGGWYFDDRQSGWKAFANLTFSESRYHDRTLPPEPLGYYALPEPPYARPYYEDNSRIDEFLADAHLEKRTRFGPLANETGLQIRYKHFRLLDTPYPASGAYDTLCILSAFTEMSWMFDPHSMVVAALKLDRYLQNGDVRDSTLISGRLRYIYNTDLWTAKLFLSYEDVAPVMQTYYVNRYLFLHPDDPETEQWRSASAKVIRHEGRTTLSLLLSRTYAGRVTARMYDDEGRPFYGNQDETMHFTSFLGEITHAPTPLSKIVFNVWETINIYKNGRPGSKNYGALAAFDTTIDRFDFHTDLIYKLFDGLAPGLDWNVALTYHPSRPLTLFVKANNILGQALKQDYWRIDPADGTLTRLDNVDVIDRRLWVGMEYQF